MKKTLVLLLVATLILQEVLHASSCPDSDKGDPNGGKKPDGEDKKGSGGGVRLVKRAAEGGPGKDDNGNSGGNGSGGDKDNQGKGNSNGGKDKENGGGRVIGDFRERFASAWRRSKDGGNDDKN